MSPSNVVLTMLVLLLTGLAPCVSMATSLTPHVAEYNVKISVASGELRTELRRSARGYTAIHSLKPRGLSRLFTDGYVTEVAEFTIADDDVVPVSYRSDDTIDKDETHARIQFDWQTNQASGTVNGEPLTTDLEGLTHDRVSIQYALMHDLLNERVENRYQMFETDELKLVNIRSIGTRQVKVPAGRFEAVGIRHQAENSSRVMTLWCVPELGFLPVIIEQHRKGKLRVRAKLSKYSPTISTESD